MLSTFASNAKTAYIPGDNNGLVYNDSEYRDGLGKVTRKTGFIPGEPISTLLVNTALRQYCAMSYVIVNAIRQILTNAAGISGWDNTDFNDLDESKIHKILYGEQSGPEAFISYIARLKNIINNNPDNESEFFAVKYTRDCARTDESNSINARISTINDTLKQKITSLAGSDTALMDIVALHFTESYQFTVLPNTTSLNECFKAIDTWLKNNGYV